MNTENNLTKTFGVSEISRELLEGLPCPICTDGVTDEQMQKLADSVEAEVRDRYPEIADKMFELWKKGDEMSYEELELLYCEYFRADELWWELLEQYAIVDLGMEYYEDMD